MALKSHNLLSACIQLAARSGEIIKTVYSSGNLGTTDKGGDDPCTVADINSQILIQSSIEKYFPGVTVVGEEKVESSEDRVASGLNFEAVPQSIIPEGLKELEAQNITIWVDPLDGTKNFTLGDTLGVTTMIGIAYRGSPLFGVLHHVFSDGPSTYWGGGALGVFRTEDPFGSYGSKLELSPCSDYSAVTTRLHSTPKMEEFIKNLHLDRCEYADGSGYKGILVLTGQVSLYVFVEPWTKKWDTCAPEALLKSIGGGIYDLSGNSYSYFSDAEHINQNGIIMCSSGLFIQNVLDEWNKFNIDSFN